MLANDTFVWLREKEKVKIKKACNKMPPNNTFVWLIGQIKK